MEDIIIGRDKASGVYFRTATTTSGSLVSQSQRRVNLVVFPPSVGMITIMPAPTVVDGEGLVLTSSSHPLMLSVDTFGDIVTRGWSVIANAGSPVIAVIETYLKSEGP